MLQRLAAAAPAPAAHAVEPAPVVEPEDLQCPVTRLLMRDPVVTSGGNTYERAALLEGWARRVRGTPRRDPLTNRPLESRLLYVNWIARRQVRALAGLCGRGSALGRLIASTCAAAC